MPLNEGDQILRINGQDITRWTQIELTTFLQKLRQNQTDLLLVIKPNGKIYLYFLFII